LKKTSSQGGKGTRTEGYNKVAARRAATDNKDTGLSRGRKNNPGTPPVGNFIVGGPHTAHTKSYTSKKKPPSEDKTIIDNHRPGGQTAQTKPWPRSNCGKK